MNDEILSIRELAAVPNIGEDTTETVAQKIELPGFEVREQRPFRRADIDASEPSSHFPELNRVRDSLSRSYGSAKRHAVLFRRRNPGLIRER